MIDYIKKFRRKLEKFQNGILWSLNPRSSVWNPNKNTSQQELEDFLVQSLEQVRRETIAEIKGEIKNLKGSYGLNCKPSTQCESCYFVEGIYDYLSELSKPKEGDV